MPKQKKQPLYSTTNLTNRQLARVLRRFPRAATILVNGSPNFAVSAQVNERGEWTVRLDVTERPLIEKNFPSGEKTSCEDEKNIL